MSAGLSAQCGSHSARILAFQGWRLFPFRFSFRAGTAHLFLRGIVLGQRHLAALLDTVHLGNRVGLRLGLGLVLGLGLGLGLGPRPGPRLGPR